MKKTFAILASISLFAASCNKDTNMNSELESVEPVSGARCASQEVLLEQIKNDPARAERLEALERFTTEYMKHPETYSSVRDAAGNVVIPVVFNVLYKTSAENISLAQLQSQIDVMNKDFSATNADYSLTPTYFQSVRSGDTKIRFTLQNVVRKATNKRSWSTNDAMKKSSQGGIDPTSPTNTLNVWVCNMGGGILGYAQFPGGPAATDGVVLDDRATGNTGTAAAPYGLGRTATHEVGHWLNLRHIWGDATCGNDQVADTPVHPTSNGGCPAFPKYGSCSSTVPMQTMNYMDYTYDACMYMFTAGQSTRMNATFSGSRIGFN
jgi:hypothetical protein